MWSVTHLVVGGALGGCVEGGGLAFAVGVASHVVMDAIPHYDIEDYRVDAALTAAGIAGLAALGLWFTPVFWGALGGVIPDLENLLWRLGVLGETRRVFPSHTRLIRHGRQLRNTGSAVIPQALLLLGALGCWILFRS